MSHAQAELVGAKNASARPGASEQQGQALADTKREVAALKAQLDEARAKHEMADTELRRERAKPKTAPPSAGGGGGSAAHEQQIAELAARLDHEESELEREREYSKHLFEQARKSAEDAEAARLQAQRATAAAAQTASAAPSADPAAAARLAELERMVQDQDKSIKIAEAERKQALAEAEAARLRLNSALAMQAQNTKSSACLLQ